MNEDKTFIGRGWSYPLFLGKSGSPIPADLLAKYCIPQQQTRSWVDAQR